MTVTIAIKKKNLESSFYVEIQQSQKPQDICLKPAPASVLSGELVQKRLIISKLCLELQVGKSA